MNTTVTTVSNVIVFTIGVGAISASVEMLKTGGDLTRAIILGVIGVAAVVLYERLPLSNPPQ